MENHSGLDLLEEHTGVICTCISEPTSHLGLPLLFCECPIVVQVGSGHKVQLIELYEFGLELCTRFSCLIDSHFPADSALQGSVENQKERLLLIISAL